LDEGALLTVYIAKSAKIAKLPKFIGGNAGRLSKNRATWPDGFSILAILAILALLAMNLEDP